MPDIIKIAHMIYSEIPFGNDISIPEIVQYLLKIHESQKDQQTAIDYIISHFKGTYVLYGAGTFSKALLQRLQNEKTIKIVGIADVKGDALKTFHGLPVKTIAQWAAHDDIKDLDILIAHPRSEAAMMQAAYAMGISETKVHCLFTSQKFTKFNTKNQAMKLASVKSEYNDKNIDHVVISTSPRQWRVVQDEKLAELYGKKNILGLHYLPSHLEEPSCIPYVSCHQSLSLMVDILQTLKPKSIYLRTTTQWANSYLMLCLHHLFPNVKIIHEAYDWAIMFQNHLLQRDWGYSETDIAIAKYSEIYSLRFSELIICKNDGPLWDEIVFDYADKVFSISPYIGTDTTSFAPVALPASDHLKIVYAGSVVPAQELVSGGVKVLHIVETIEKTITDHPDISFDLYNVLHTSPDQDDMFSYYSDRYNDNPQITYHRRINSDKMLDKLTEYDVGWLFMDHSNKQQIPYNAMVSMPNKVSSYIFAGLPIITNTTVNYVASLILLFNAGIVASNYKQLSKKLNRFNTSKAKQGVLALRDHIIKNNQSRYKRLQQHMRAL